MESVIFAIGLMLFTLTVVFALLKRSKPQPKQDHPQTPSNGLNEGLGGLNCDACQDEKNEELKKINNALNNLIVSYSNEIRLYEITSPYSPEFTSLVMALPSGRVRELYYSMSGNLSEFEYKSNPKDIVTYIGSLEC